MRLLSALTIIVLFSCNSCTTKNNPDALAANDTLTFTEDLLQQNSVKTLDSLNHMKLDEEKGDLNSFRQYLEKLPVNKLVSIPYALGYIKTCIPSGSPDQDSVFLVFNTWFYAVTNQLSDSLEKKYKIIVDQLNENSVSSELTAFRDNLAYCGIEILSSEGMYFLDVMPDYFYINFRDRVSAGVAQYLTIRKDELKQGFSEDAGMLITFGELYQRVKSWEEFQDKFPSTVYAADADYYLKTYLATLLTGMDNSRVFDSENSVLLPERKQLYEKIIKEDPQSESGKIISSYYSLLKSHNFKDNTLNDIFLKENKT